VLLCADLLIRGTAAHLGCRPSSRGIADAAQVGKVGQGAAWRAKHVNFCRALKVGKEQADDRVEGSLYQRAVGYTYESCKIIMSAGARKPVIVPYLEHVPPGQQARKRRGRRSGALILGLHGEPCVHGLGLSR
jgi:hypothetical protein